MNEAAALCADGITGVVCTSADSAEGIIEYQNADLTVGCDRVGQLCHRISCGICRGDTGFDRICRCEDLIDLDIAVDVPEKYDLKQPQNQKQDRYEDRKIGNQLPTDADLREFLFCHTDRERNLRLKAVSDTAQSYNKSAVLTEALTQKLDMCVESSGIAVKIIPPHLA